MDITENELRDRYKKMSTDEIIKLFKEGGLTPIAFNILKEEVKSRDIDLSESRINNKTNREISDVSSPAQTIENNNSKLWLTIFVLSWIIGSFGYITAGSLRGSLIDIFVASLGSGLGLLLFSLVPAFIISLGFRLTGKPLSEKSFLLLLIYCIVIMGILNIIGQLHMRN